MSTDSTLHRARVGQRAKLHIMAMWGSFIRRQDRYEVSESNGSLDERDIDCFVEVMRVHRESVWQCEFAPIPRARSPRDRFCCLHIGLSPYLRM